MNSQPKCVTQEPAIIPSGSRAVTRGRQSSPVRPTGPQSPLGGSLSPLHLRRSSRTASSHWNTQATETQQKHQKHLSGDFQHTQCRGCSKFRAAQQRCSYACPCISIDLIAKPACRCGPSQADSDPSIASPTRSQTDP